ncbi:hypothetical protein BV22DRAFT_1032896 [Leucogyrophana mollusca]|uniref:Uncharacterized protein n=1 Tax=Leucogyrophana mollusca TaxID=85980 RepID=A0ACB8BKJ8_9AGAM|nr:hypothetical protein BV22DRAFT_1032896 [Leucogyrophana mollusca]
MSLDQNLFTLLVTPNTSDTTGTVLDLVDPSGNVHYRKRRILGQVYKIEVYDPISESLLASATAPSATSKHKTLQLYNPAHLVELKYTGTLSFRWSFKWEEHEFEWKREECFMIRKPDPPVLVAVTKEPPGRIKTASVQILDYNLNRFDVEDRKGLEIVILTALLTFQDQSDTYHEPPSTSAAVTPAATPPILKSLTTRKASGETTSATTPPARPPKPAPKTGIDRIAELQAGTGEVNQVTIGEEGAIKDYAQYCAKLLEDEAMLFITVRSSDAVQVPKVLQVVEETKRLRHKAGLSNDKDLHQYVVYDNTKPPTQKGPKVINLDDDKSKGKGKDEGKYAPPNSLVVHLSKIDMPEFRPRPAAGSSSRQLQNDVGKDGERREGRKERKEREKQEKEKREKDREREKKAKAKSPTANSSSPAGKTAKVTKASPVPPNHSRSHVRSHQIHPSQPSPSPSQLNNPAIYAAPPLPPRAPNHYPARPPYIPPYQPYTPITPNHIPYGTQGYGTQNPAPSTAASATVSGLLGKFLGGM